MVLGMGDRIFSYWENSGNPNYGVQESLAFFLCQHFCGTAGNCGMSRLLNNDSCQYAATFNKNEAML